MHSIRTLQISAAVLAVLTISACGKKDEAPTLTIDSSMSAPTMPAASVTTIETGKHLGADARVSDATTTFGPRDTLYVSVVTNNSTPTSSLSAKWTYQDGQMVDSTTQMVARTDIANPMAVTNFFVVKPTGWPVGVYTVEIWLDGMAAGTKQLEVKR